MNEFISKEDHDEVIDSFRQIIAMKNEVIQNLKEGIKWEVERAEKSQKEIGSYVDDREFYKRMYENEVNERKNERKAHESIRYKVIENNVKLLDLNSQIMDDNLQLRKRKWWQR